MLDTVSNPITNIVNQHEQYLGCLVAGHRGEKFYLFSKGDGVLEGYLYKGEALVEKIPSHRIQGGLDGEIPNKDLVGLISEVGKRCLFALYNPQSADKKMILLPALPAEGNLEEYALSYLEPPCPSSDFISRELIEKVLEDKFSVSSVAALVNEGELDCQTGKTEVAKHYFFGHRDDYTQTLWLQGEQCGLIEQGLQEFSKRVNEDWRSWLISHSGWLLVIDGLADINLLKELDLIHIAQQGQGKLLITTREDPKNPSIQTIFVSLFRPEESKAFLLQATGEKDESSAEKVAEALGGVPSSMQKAVDLVRTNKAPLGAYFSLKDAELAEHQAYLMSRSNLPPLNVFFTGREVELVTLEEQLAEHKPLVLAATVGLGGVGKTQIALQYAYRLALRYKFIWKLNAENEVSLLQSYISLADKLEIFVTKEEEKEDKARVKKVKQWLKQNPGWLLIFDNAQNQEALNDWLPESGGPVLITSRNREWSNAKVLTIGLFRKEEAIELILKITQHEDQKKEAGELADLLERLPLAIAQAAFYIKETNIPIVDYIAEYRRQYQIIWKFEAPPDRYHATVQLTWKMSMQKIREEEKLLLAKTGGQQTVDPLMQLCAYLSSAPIPLSLLNEWAEKNMHSDTPLYDVCQATDLLCRYSMIEAAPGTITLHSLVQLVTRDCLEKEEQKVVCAKGVKLLSEVFKYDEIEWNKVKNNQALVVHVESLIDHANKLTVEEIVTLCLKDYTGRYLVASGAYKKAFKTYQECLKKGQDLKNEAAIATSLNNLGNVLKELGKYAKAKKKLEKAEKVTSTIFPSDTTFLAESHINLGGVLDAEGNYREAKTHYEKALQIYEKTLSPDHPSFAVLYTNLGLVMGHLDFYPESEEYLKKALKIFEKNYPAGHPRLATAHINLGTVLEERGKFPEAKEQHEKALKINEEAHPAGHPSLADNYDKLGSVFQELGDFPEAKIQYEKALQIYENIFPADHPSLAKSHNNLGIALRHLRLLDEAKEHLKKALKIYKKVYPVNHPSLGGAHINLGNVLLDLKHYQKAKDQFEKALEIFEKAFPDAYHSSLALTHIGLGNALCGLKLNSQAREQYKKALQIQKQIYPPDHPALGMTYNNLGSVSEDYVEAKVNFEKALEIYKKVLPAGHPVLADLYNNLGYTLCKLRLFDEAKTQFESAFHISEKNQLIGHSILAIKLLELAQFSINLENWQDAQEYLEKALAICEENMFTDQLSNPHVNPFLAQVLNVLEQVLIIHADQFLQMGNSKEAKQKYKKFINLHIRYPLLDKAELSHVYQNLGCCYHVQSKLKKARKNLEIASQLNPSSGVFCEFGHFLYINGLYPEAIESLLKALDHKADARELSYTKLELKIIDADLRPRIEQEEKISITASILAYKLLINCYLQLGDLDNANKILIQFTEDFFNSPSNPMTGYLMNCAVEAIFQAESLLENPNGSMLN